MIYPLMTMVQIMSNWWGHHEIYKQWDKENPFLYKPQCS